MNSVRIYACQSCGVQMELKGAGRPRKHCDACGYEATLIRNAEWHKANRKNICVSKDVHDKIKEAATTMNRSIPKQLEVMVDLYLSLRVERQ